MVPVMNVSASVQFVVGHGDLCYRNDESGYSGDGAHAPVQSQMECFALLNAFAAQSTAHTSFGRLGLHTLTAPINAFHWMHCCYVIQESIFSLPVWGAYFVWLGEAALPDTFAVSLFTPRRQLVPVVEPDSSLVLYRDAFQKLHPFF